MIEHASGNLLDATVEALVNSVNTVGVMGRGVALQFKQAFPENFKAYERACRHNEVRLGEMWVFETRSLTGPKYIINFPTKGHWRSKSRLKDIEQGLQSLAKVIRERKIKSIAVPPLGCGNGGLNWRDVLPCIEAAFLELPDVHALVFAPEGAPSPARMRIGTKPPSMTPARAALLGLLRLYGLPGYHVTMLEIQKLAYFLQQAGERLKLRFVRGSYGPYAENLNFVLQRLEGHYIRGYGDRSIEASIQLLPNAEVAARTMLERSVSTKERLARVGHLIDGFETPYGLELLSTVHFVACEDPSIRDNAGLAIEAVQSWSARKRERFSPEHIRLAWSHLLEDSWMV